MNSNEFKKVTRELCKKLVNIENTECVVCLEEIKVGTLMLPCSHYQICMTCSALDNDTCPLCRQSVNFILHYYKKDEYGRNICSVADAINYNPTANTNK